MPRKILPADLPPHPRLLATPDDWTRLRREDDPVSAAFARSIRRRADALLALRPLERVMTGRRLLLVSREALERILVLAITANVSGERRFADRARQEMRAIAAFTDWNPSHFLDTAEMSFALAVGYDWLFEHLDPDERGSIVAAIIGKGITPSLDGTAKHNWWHEAPENWNQVCHGGLGAAAIAIADSAPALAESVLQRALDSIPIAAASYAPDGIYPEGPMYWTYGTSYHVVLAAALQRLLGTACGLDELEGFAESAGYLGEMTAPSGRFFNFGDCRDARRSAAPLFWMARHFRKGEWLTHDLEALPAELAIYDNDAQVEHGVYDMLGLGWLWHDASLATSAPARSTRTWIGDGPVPIAVFRRDDLYVAMKGGSAAVSHAHMDAGSFVLESQGVRWAVDPGMQEYESLEREGLDLWNQQQQSERWTVFRIGPDAHSILRVDAAPQRVEGTATLVASNDEAAVFDLSAVYSPHKVQRGIRVTADRCVLIQDEWTAAPTAQRVSFQFITRAGVVPGDRGALLRDGDVALRLRVLDPIGVTVTVTDISAPVRPYDAPNPGLTRVAFSVPATAGRLAVLCSPATADAQPTPFIAPLADWIV